MIQQRLKAAAVQANLSKEEKANVDALAALLDTHQQLSNLPPQQATQKFNSLPAGQQQSLVQFAGTDAVEPKRGWFGNALHYAGNVLTALNKPSDFVMQQYRQTSIAQIPGNEKKSFSQLWAEAGKGEGYFRPDKIKAAEEKFGPARVALAQKVRQGQSLDSILATGTPAEQALAANVVKGKDGMWQDAYDAVMASQISPGRDVANALLPSKLEGTGFLYKGISGLVDAGYRLITDPLMALGKAKKAYDVANYSLFAIAKNGEKIDQVFAKPAVTKFFDTYGKELDNLSTARKAGDMKAAVVASDNLKRLAPEFGPTAVDEFIKAGVKDAQTAKNYLQNAEDITTILKGQAARQTPLIPRLDLRRQARVNFFTAADKAFNMDRVGQKVVRALYGTEPQYADIATGLTNQTELIGQVEKSVGRLKGKTGAQRYSLDQIQGRIDRFARKFTTIPYFKDGFFDVMSADASDKVYQVARLANTRYHSKIIKEAFEAGDEGQRKQIFTGLWNTVAEIRNVSKSAAGKSYMDAFAGSGRTKMYAADIVKDGVNEGNPAVFGDQQMALFPYQLSSGIAVPSVIDLDRLSVRAGLINRLMGLSHGKWAERMTSLWSIGTLAGPRFAIRNATEDLMMHLAIGDSTWGIVQGRMLSTRLRLAKGIGGDATALEKAKGLATLNTAAGEVGAINKFLRKNELEYFNAKMAGAKTVQEVREIYAEAVMRSGLPAKMDEQGAGYIAEIARYGNLDERLGAVGEGGKSALSGADQYINATNDAVKYGSMAPIEVNGVAYKQALGEKSFTQFNPVANQQAQVSWLVQLGIAANDDLAKIAIKYMGNTPEAEARAVNAMEQYLLKLKPEERARFSLYATGATEKVHAKKAYDATRNMFTKNYGKDINEELLNKVRYVDETGEVVVSSKNLTIHDLPSVGDAANAPVYISGPTLVPVSESGNFAASMVERTWDAMGEANARFSREPIVLNEMIRVRREMDESGYTQRLLDQLTAGKTGEDLVKAETYARKQIVATAEELAVGRVLSYVDNPAVRSQMAMAARNFARFYRATEDFYRRIYRTVKYNPESIRRAALTYEGVAHSGWVQTDDNGDQYFFYPGLTPVYQAMNNVLKGLGVGDAFKAPMPVEFGGKLKMITPSMNPDSLFPTFAGPLAAFPLKVLFNYVPQLNSLENSLMGQYSEDQPMINAVLPAHVTRLLAALNKDERSSQYASAFRKAATYLEAAGYGLKPKWDPETKTWIAPTPGEQEEYQNKLEASTLTVLAVRFLFGFVAPASPQITLKSDMAQWVRDNGRTSYKQVWNNLIKQYGDIDKATEQWIRLFPDQMPYTISESEPKTIAVVKAVSGATEWIDKNQALLKQYPEAASFLIPKVGDFDFNAYKALYKSGLKQSKTLYDFLRQVQTSRDETFYYQQKDAYEAQLATTYGEYGKKLLNDQWTTWSDEFKKARPMLQEELGSGAGRQIQRLRALQDMTDMLNDKSVTVEPETRGKLKQMLDKYNSYVYSRDLITNNTSTSLAYKDLLKQNIKAELQQIAGDNPNAMDAYTSLFARLIRD
jgi:hypothetical protein